MWISREIHARQKFLRTWIGYGCKLCHQQALSTLLYTYDKEKKPINFHIHFVLEKKPILRCTLEQVIFAGCYFLYILTKSPIFGICIFFEIAGRQWFKMLRLTFHLFLQKTKTTPTIKKTCFFFIDIDTIQTSWSLRHKFHIHFPVHN